MKNAISEMNNALEGIKSRLNETEDPNQWIGKQNRNKHPVKATKWKKD